MALTTDISLEMLFQFTETADMGGVPRDTLDYSKRIQLATGTAAGQADVLFYDQRSINASSSEDLDLAGVLIDNQGNTVTFAKIKGIVVVAAPKDPNATQNTNNVVVGAAAATAWAALLGATGTATLRPGTTFAVFAGQSDATGYAVAGGSTDLLKIANSGAGTSVTYQIILFGTSA